MQKKEEQIVKTENSNIIDLIDLEEKPKDSLVSEEDSTINEEKKDNTLDLFDNLIIREPLKKEANLDVNLGKSDSTPIKFYKEGNTVLNNDFFKNFLKNNHTQQHYNREIIDTLLNVSTWILLFSFC